MTFLSDNWFDVIQTLAIIVTLLVTAAALRKTENTEKVGNSFLLTQYHRELWTYYLDNLDNLNRILSRDCNLDDESITKHERMFATLLFLHLSTALKAQDANAIYPVEGMEADFQDILKNPIPRAVWSRIEPFQDRITVKFIRKCLAEIQPSDGSLVSSNPQKPK